MSENLDKKQCPECKQFGRWTVGVTELLCDSTQCWNKRQSVKQAMNCKNCKCWNKMDHRDGYGHCKSDGWNVNPNYYEDSDRVTELNMVEVTYQPITGLNFGCIHFEEKSE